MIGCFIENRRRTEMLGLGEEPIKEVETDH